MYWAVWRFWNDLYDRSHGAGRPLGTDSPTEEKSDSQVSER